MSDIEPADELASLLEDLHDSEINGETGWFFDRVWRAKIGDPWNGYRAEKDGLLSLGEAAEWLRSKAIELYPNSEFAEAHGARNERASAVRFWFGAVFSGA